MSFDNRKIPSGIAPLDERVGGLHAGGSYLVVGAPGPEKMVAALQFVHAGVGRGERCLLLTNSDAESILGVAQAWGFEMRDAWLEGTLQLVGFRDDFELRAIRSIAPEEVVEELDRLVASELDRIAVDPGTMLLSGGARSLLGSTYLSWARSHTATALTTFSVDGGATSLPSSADWLFHATTGRLLLQRRDDDLYQVTVSQAVPEPGAHDETITLEMRPGAGLVEPEHFRSRRESDRGGIDEGRLLLVSLGGSHASDLEAWAARRFDTDVVSEALEAVAKVQSDVKYGAVLIHSPRTKVRDAIRACMAIRPLTRAAIVFASDDAIRSTDRIQILEAGADDSLSGGVDFRELSLRIKQSMGTGAKPVPAEPRGEGKSAAASIPKELKGGRVPRSVFVDEVSRRAADSDLAFFCILDIRAPGLGDEEMEKTLADQVRADEGDLVSADSGRCAVLLQGARKQQLDALLSRLRSTLQARTDGTAVVEIDVLSHPAESDRIMTLLGASGAKPE
ncbi:MAG: ATPase domain-containing protein [Longimicrobiales bacterium]|nr:ATPase domain-containing protein [Longimicrobiales bacterium]